ncbi:hypothetical protein DVH24_009886 [Malus domestica]|uniref:Uncharacterized protein n=1 Tax=Malus domestica TaxID=3750 RepID=A0A498JWJ9_MALDO|nr:hypothetical protein DVH24_009886 [Malus domestica]
MGEEMKSPKALITLRKKSRPLPFSKEFLDELMSGDTRALRVQSYEGLIDSYNHMNGLTHIVEGLGNNNAIFDHP